MRPIFKLCLFLLLGAIINVAVAWECALCSPVHTGLSSGGLWRFQNWQYSINELEWRDELRSDAIGLTYIEWFGLKKDQSPAQSNEFRIGQMIGRITYRAGWPLVSLAGHWNSRDEIAGAYQVPVWLWPTQSWSSHTPRLIPVCPIWPGFAINTIFYAAVLWLLFAAPGTIRRRRRIKRGLCPACAYPVGASDVCTECGKAVRA